MSSLTGFDEDAAGNPAAMRSTTQRMSPASTENDGKAVRHFRAITVNRPVAEVFAFWRDVENLPVGHLAWEGELLDEQPDRMIRWRTRTSLGTQHIGEVTFAQAPGGRGTEVGLSVSYRTRTGPIGAALARLIGEHPDQRMRDDLRHMKQVLECGAIVTADELVSARDRKQRRATARMRRRLSIGGRP
jgi:uncharacterized membrane protein